MATTKSASSRSSGGAGRGAQPITDHDQIRQWAEARGAKPTCVRGTGGGGDTGMIRLDFPGFSGEESLQEISWDEWFQAFDENNLALLFQETTTGGQQSNFNKLVSRNQPTARSGGKSAGGGSSRRGGASAGGRKSSAGGRKSSAGGTRKAAGGGGRSATGGRSTARAVGAAGGRGGSKSSGGRSKGKSSGTRSGGSSGKPAQRKAAGKSGRAGSSGSKSKSRAGGGRR